MALSVYNDLTRTKEKFVPIEEGRVRFYVCGPTVYNFFHIGNARPFVLFDVFRRYLESLGYEVTFIQNFTDIDDKMIRRANEEGTTVAELAERFIAEYYRDADALGIRRATVNPRATQEMPAIIDVIKRLIEKGHAYEIDGDVYFSVESFKDYGRLSKQSVDELISGARVEVDERKREPLDFALWKGAKPGEPFWESPWGKGRPGWHIECSAMSNKYLGSTIDIHGGGSDLIFPHHENEIAQSECANDAHFVRYWLHNAYLLIDKEKMSKSLGNFLTVRDVRQRISPLVLRFFLMSVHYRSPLNFSAEGLEHAKGAVERLNNCCTDLIFALENRSAGEKDEALRMALKANEEGFAASMDDDFNTAGAFGFIFENVRAVNVHLSEHEAVDKEGLEAAKAFFDKTNDILGYLVKEEKEGDGDAEIDELVAERSAARKAKDFKRSDEIRETLAAKGIIIEDTPQGPRWKRTM
ncbi:cysteine--tRNA ligase [Synergistes jonesii]|uniref:Cysteine--tRNA ligase n=1 Tax=Synergistes jonesii TaxID=2754 RepID=A0A073IPA8_9BACT|nr:cysteine--tRNA ligase [Synergistes jonesii]KEJ91326.1 cysteinyl-tRNA synthetase [Synergistes jonesii]OFB60394.1 cysteinyl-tRNA synthetase [Synergistes jonesii]OFB61219.1 cysteinyl-tRNA synthetase [Synergistes jonesii]OFB62898.1 cysteinyl-tRNA synthetase [Synergistes jonesii]OFB66605.1 cysteinyl-tRNA synthetase [Synergistes jonesii]